VVAAANGRPLRVSYTRGDRQFVRMEDVSAFLRCTDSKLTTDNFSFNPWAYVAGQVQADGRFQQVARAEAQQAAAREGAVVKQRVAPISPGTSSPPTAPASTEAPPTAPASTEAPPTAAASTWAPPTAPAFTEEPPTAPASTEAPPTAPAFTEAPPTAPASTEALGGMVGAGGTSCA